MRYIIYISIFLASVFCFVQAQAQGVSMFGASRAQDTSKTKGQIVAPAYSNNDSNKVLTADASGHFYYVTKSNGSAIDTTKYIMYSDTSRSGIITTYYYVDSLFDNIPVVDLSGIRDTLTYVYDTFSVHWSQIYANYIAVQQRVKYSDSTGFLPTKTYLSQNYFAQGGNTFGATGVLGTNGANHLDFETNNTTRIRVFSNGNVAIGTTTDNGYKVDVAGRLKFGSHLNTNTILGDINFDNSSNAAYIKQDGSILRSIKVPGTGGHTSWEIRNTAGNGITIINSGVPGNRVDINPGTNNTTGSPRMAFRLSGINTPAYSISNVATSQSDVNLIIGSGETIYANDLGYNVKIQSGAGGAPDKAGGNIVLDPGAGGGSGHAGYIIHEDVPEYADNAAALAAGLPIGAEYRTGDIKKIVH